MPSLRRSFSTSSARSSPYHATSSSTGNRVRGHARRRSSASETSGRRVLADIEWWRVVDGQRDLDNQESEDRDRDENHDRQTPVTEQAFAGLTVDPTDVGAGHPSSPSTSLDVPSSPEVLPLRFSELAITPPLTPPRRRHSRESSISSLDSTPESPESLTDSPTFGFADFDTRFEDAAYPPSPSPFTHRRLRSSPPSFDMFSIFSGEGCSTTATSLLDGLDFPFTLN